MPLQLNIPALTWQNYVSGGFSRFIAGYDLTELANNKSAYNFTPMGTFGVAQPLWADGVIVDNLLGTGAVVVLVGQLVINVPAYTRETIPLSKHYPVVNFSGTQSGCRVTFYTGAPPVSSMINYRGAIVNTFGSGCTPQGRLTLFNGQPVPNIAQVANNATQMIYSPYLGCIVPIWDGTQFQPIPAPNDIICNLSDTSKNPGAVGNNDMNDWFLWYDGTLPGLRLVHSLAWGSDTVRVTGGVLNVRNQGILTNNSDIANGPAAGFGTYVGSSKASSSGTLRWIPGTLAPGGGNANYNIWNMYNRIEVTGMCRNSDDSWNYSTNTWRAAEASASWRLFCLNGYDEDPVTVMYHALASHTLANNAMQCGVGLDVTNAFTGTTGWSSVPAGSIVGICGGYSGMQGLGFHTFCPVENCSAGAATGTFYGDSASPTLLQTGLHYRLRL